jgi:hypothetical protein
MAPVCGWDICVVASRSEYSFSYLNGLRYTIQFTTETESMSAIPLLDVLAVRKETKIYKKPAHSSRYFHFRSNHPSLFMGFYEVELLPQSKNDKICLKIDNLRGDLQLSTNPQKLHWYTC